MSISERREARERALSLLYEAAAKQIDPREVLEGLTLPPDPYCALLVTSASERHEASLALIESTASNWPLDRIGVIDRLVMELALAELLSDDPPPVAVVLDEAVELAKMFSTESSGSFVNGILAAIVATLPPRESLTSSE